MTWVDTYAQTHQHVNPTRARANSEQSDDVRWRAIVGGRTRYNRARQDARKQRLETIFKAHYIAEYDVPTIARMLSICKSTIYRDLQTIRYLCSGGRDGKLHGKFRKISAEFTIEDGNMSFRVW